MFSFFKKSSDKKRVATFMARFQGKTLLIHQGLTREWVDDLMEVGGGAAMIRIDVNKPLAKPPTPVEWVVHQVICPLELPYPILVKVENKQVLIRHLNKFGNPVHPGEIAWYEDEMAERYHARLVPEEDRFQVIKGIEPDDNTVETPYGFSM